MPSLSISRSSAGRSAALSCGQGEAQPDLDAARRRHSRTPCERRVEGACLAAEAVVRRADAVEADADVVEADVGDAVAMCASSISVPLVDRPT